jgi:glycosyltransferase involved in cell wall biosynthesis
MAYGGTEKHVLTLMRGQKEKFRLFLLAPMGEILDEFLKLDVHFFEFPVLKGNVQKKIRIFRNKLKEIYQQYGIDILHIHAAHEFTRFSKRTLPHVPVVFHLSAHQGSSLSRAINYKLSAGIAKRNADLLIAVSDEEKRLIVKKGFPQDRIVVVYNGYEGSEGDDIAVIKKIKKQYTLEGSLIIGNLGRLNKTKRLDLLISAFGELKKRVKEKTKLVFIGEGPERKRLEKLALAGGVGKDVIFTGFVPRGDRVLKIFDVFVLPTTYEGCSNVLVEAMAKALPIVTTDIPSVSWMFEDGKNAVLKNAVLFEKNNVKSLEEKLYRLVTDATLRKRVVDEVFLRFEADFTAEAMVEKVERVYQSLF